MIRWPPDFNETFAIERLLNLLLDVMQFEYRPLFLVKLDSLEHLGNEGGGELPHLAMRARLIDEHPVHVGPQHVAKDPQVQRQVGVHQIPRRWCAAPSGGRTPRACAGTSCRPSRPPRAHPPRRCARCIPRSPAARGRPEPRLAAARARPRARSAPTRRRRALAACRRETSTAG